MHLKRTIFFLVLFVSCLTINKAWATHERAGYIIWEHIYNANAPYYYKFTVVTYTKESSYLADRQYLTVLWGDGTKEDSIPRTFKDSTLYPYVDNVKENFYTGYHSYSGAATYQISMTDANRIYGIINIDENNSVNIPLCLIDTMTILPSANFGFDSSPVVLNPPIQYGEQFQTFIYNPSCYDPDGDSLSYQLIIPRESPLPEPAGDVLEYKYPTEISPGPNNQETLDPVTGTFTWTTPQEEGIYNIAILVSEYRRYNGHYYKNGSVDIDMQIVITASYDNPPYIYPVKDTCIVAGQTLHTIVTASDDLDKGNYSTYLTLTATGTPFEADAPDTATFVATNGGEYDTAWGQFNWNTVCNDISAQTYVVVFKALDSYITPLSYNRIWNITVVAPPPDSLKATPTGNMIVLNWKSPYTCATATSFLGFTVWRKTGCDSVAPDTCDPTSVLTGYTEITPNPIRQYTYADNSVLQGIDYSYLVLAEFGDSTYTGYVYNEVYGLSSNEVCAHLKKDVPVITNVSVVTTDTANGSMYVAWSKPSIPALDTTEYPGPYEDSIFRSVGFIGTNHIFLTSYSKANFLQFNDTTFEDTLIDTKDHPYSYIVKFYSNNGDTLVGTTNIASSIYLTLVGNNHIVTLTWSENVPWTNDSFTVYRQNHTTKLFDSITTLTAQTYTDKGLENDTTYCYKVKSRGHYSIGDITNPLINYSQINCTVPVDTTRPCAPTLAVTNDCNSNNNFGAFINQLQWTLNQAACVNSSILKFYIYYAPYENQPLQLIDSTSGPNVYIYASVLNNTLAGCYAVASEDSGYTLSYKSNIVCVNNCPEYNLPNVFTPNGDEHNDLFTPILPYQFIDHIDMHIYNRWGELVFETTDPMINWNGKSFNTGKQCPDGVYYYTCEVYENTLTGIVKLNPPLKGYIQILR